MRLLAFVLLVTATACGRGGFTPADGTDEPGTPDILPVLPLYPQHARWNTYVARAPGTPSWKQADAPCAAADTLGDCVHGGEARYVVVPGATSCVGHEAHDALGAFDWRCDADDGVRFVTTALRPEVVLADLLDGSNGFALNSVIVDGVTGTPRVWWDNPVAPLPTTTSLNATDTVYVATGAPTQGYQVDADGVSVVVPRGQALSFAAGPAATCIPELALGAGKRCLVRGGAHERLWLEGNFDVTGNFELAVGLSGSSLTQVRHAVLQRGGYGLVLVNTHAVDMSRSTSASHVRYGVVLHGTSGTRLFHDAIHQIQPTEGSAGLLVEQGNADTTVVDVVIDGGAQFGLQAAGAPLQNTVTNLAFLTVVNNQYNGIGLAGFTTATLTQVASMNNGLYGIAIGDGSNLSMGELALAYNDTAPLISGSTAPFTKSNIVADLALDAHALTSSSAGFMGKDIGAVDASAITNWSRPAYHSYARDADGFPMAALRTACTSGLCADWDWRLNADRGGIAFRSLNGEPGTSTFIAGAACPAMPQLDDGRGHSFLVNAIEIQGDGFGDDDGLCESAEICVYAPHIGAYQGAGELIGPCSSAPLGVTLMAYSEDTVPITF